MRKLCCYVRLSKTKPKRHIIYSEKSISLFKQIPINHQDLIKNLKIIIIFIGSSQVISKIADKHYMNTLHLVKHCNNKLGALDSKVKAQIYHYLYKGPSEELWRQIYWRLVNPKRMTTIEQLVFRVNPSLMNAKSDSSWIQIPTSEELHLALFENWADLDF